jgi:hypothetical protein
LRIFRPEKRQEIGSYDIYSTALGAMTLEVYYRFERQQEGIRLGDVPQHLGSAAARPR